MHKSGWQMKKEEVWWQSSTAKSKRYFYMIVAPWVLNTMRTDIKGRRKQAFRLNVSLCLYWWVEAELKPLWLNTSQAFSCHRCRVLESRFVCPLQWTHLQFMCSPRAWNSLSRERRKAIFNSYGCNTGIFMIRNDCVWKGAKWLIR